MPGVNHERPIGLSSRQAGAQSWIPHQDRK
jgi:hypothetical protein